MLACVWGTVAKQALAAGDAAQAQELERRATNASCQGLLVARHAGNLGCESSILLNLAHSFRLTGRADEALALPNDRERGHHYPLPGRRGQHLASRAKVLDAQGQHEAAVHAYEAPLVLPDDEARRVSIAEALSEVLERCGRWQEALEHYKQFHQMQLRLSAERVRRSARLAALRPDIERERARARRLAVCNEELHRRADDSLRQAHEDALTGLPNRCGIDAWRRESERRAAVLMIDVDHFKAINDRFSHEVGVSVPHTLRCRCCASTCSPRT